MAINRVRKFRTVDEVQTFLNGGVVGSTMQSAQGAPSNNAAGVNSLVGTTLTLIGSGPTGSVTFGTAASATLPGTNPDPYTLLFKDIKAQIEAAIAGVLVTTYAGALVIQEATPSKGITIAHGTAGGYVKVIGTVDLNTLTYGGGGSVDGLTVTINHSAGGAHTATFVAPGNRGAIVTQLNAVFVSRGVTASIDGNNHLVFTGTDQGAAATIAISGTALVTLGITAATYTGAATNTANALLGFDANNDTVGKYYLPAAAAGSPPVAPYWVWMNSLGGDNMTTVFTFE